MITGGVEQARDEIFDRVQEVATAAGGVLTNWQADLADEDVDVIMFMVTMQHFSGRQRGMAAGGRRWESQGVLTVGIRAPVLNGGLTSVDGLATLLVNALRGYVTPNGVWFRNVTPREVPGKDGNVRTDVTAEFLYQEMS